MKPADSIGDHGIKATPFHVMLSDTGLSNTDVTAAKGMLPIAKRSQALPSIALTQPLSVLGGMIHFYIHNVFCSHPTYSALSSIKAWKAHTDGAQNSDKA